MNHNVSRKTSAQMVLVSKEFLRRMEREMSLASLVIANLRSENEKLENKVKGLKVKVIELKEKVLSVEKEFERFKDDELVEGICRAQDCLRGKIEGGEGWGQGNDDLCESFGMDEVRELACEFVRKVQEEDGKENNEHSNFLNLINSSNFYQATHHLLTYILRTPNPPATPIRTQQTEASSDTSSSYSEVLKNSKVLLNTLMTQKSRLEHLNLQISKKTSK